MKTLEIKDSDLGYKNFSILATGEKYSLNNQKVINIKFNYLGTQYVAILNEVKDEGGFIAFFDYLYKERVVLKDNEAAGHFCNILHIDICSSKSFHDYLKKLTKETTDLREKSFMYQDEMRKFLEVSLAKYDDMSINILKAALINHRDIYHKDINEKLELKED